MAGTARTKSQSGPSTFVAQVVYSKAALADLERTFEFIAREDSAAGVAAAKAIGEAVSTLANHPLLGRIVERDLRELVISYGKTGYVALYWFSVERAEIWILGIRHQRELDYPAS